MDDSLSDFLPSFPKLKRYRVYFLQEWVDHFKNDSHFDDSAIPIHTAKEYDKNFKSTELVKIYKKLKQHHNFGKEESLMPQRIENILRIAFQTMILLLFLSKMLL